MSKEYNAVELVVEEARKISSLCLTAVIKFEKILGPKLAQDIYYHVVAGVVGAAAHSALTKNTKLAKVKKKTYEETKNDFVEAKSKIQEAVSAGVTAAMKTFSGQNIEYYCQIKVVPPVANDKEC